MHGGWRRHLMRYGTQVRQHERVQDAAVRSEAMRHAMPLEPYTAQDYAADEHASLEAMARRAARRVGLYAKKLAGALGRSTTSVSSS